MVVIYEYTGSEFEQVVEIDEETGEVSGDSDLAAYFRAGFDSLRDDGYTPEDHMDKITDRLYENYRNGHYWAE